MIHVVTSKDGVSLATESDARTVPFDRALAARSTAEELIAQGDFWIVQSLDDLLVPEEQPRIASPAERRASFRLIQGGKP